MCHGKDKGTNLQRQKNYKYSNCDIFIVIVTFASLIRSKVEKETLQAQKEKIIPCFYRSIRKDKIKWGSKKFKEFKKSNNSMQNCIYF